MRFPATVRVTRDVYPNGLPVVTAEIDVTEADGSRPIPGGDPGDQGAQGDPQPAFQWMGDATPAQLAQMNLQDTDRLKAWRDPATNNMHVWTGSFWKVSTNVYGPRGPEGPATGLMVRNADAGSDTASAELSGVAPDQTLMLRIPRGLRGNPGAAAPAEPIRSVSDYDNTIAPKAGQVIAFSAASQKFGPVTSPMLVGPFAMPMTTADTTQPGGPSIQLGRLTIAALPFDWRPIIFGTIECGKTTDGWGDSDAAYVKVLMSQSDRASIDVAIGSSVGSRGLGCAVIGPTLIDAITPSDRARVVRSGMEVSFTVQLGYYGQGQVSYRQRRSNLTVWAQPL
ncbi:hypothetical protein [Prescottella agglutinans]|uniref:Phage tail protein n=1 Tax=Prescottella agglutinans TaxID=1644129 RepID=A0ABT6MEP5_9NOCA|nr:hypothetical protein [Prescottella agglutinans]MDH6282796.1 hypothetical protein [Prescottella agglutinans]